MGTSPLPDSSCGYNVAEARVSRRRAVLMVVTSATLFGLMAFCAKLASRQIPGTQVAFIRFTIGSLPFLLIRRYRREALTFDRFDLLFYRGFFGGVAVLFYFLAIAHIPVGVATLLNYTAPIFSGLFAALFIGELVKPATAIPLAVAFTGVVLVVHAHAAPGEFLGFGKWHLLGICSAVLSGAAVTAVRVARRTESSWSIYASFTLFGWLAAAPFALWSWKQPTRMEWGFLIAVAISSIGAQLLMTSALRWVDAVTTGAISQLAVIVSMLLGTVWLHERTTAAGALGSLLTIGGVLAVILLNATPEPSAFDEPAEQ